MVFCRDCGKPIAPGGCSCGFMNRRPFSEERERRRLIGRSDPYRKPLIPPVLSLPAACLILGFLSGVLVGLIVSVVIRRAF